MLKSVGDNRNHKFAEARLKKTHSNANVAFALQCRRLNSQVCMGGNTRMFFFLSAEHRLSEKMF